MSIETQLQLHNNLVRVEQTIAEAAQQFGRNLEEIQLVTVTKSRTLKEIYFAIETGLQHFGESYVQEAFPKIEILSTSGIVWHFIGPIQSNKTQMIAKYFDWVQSLASLKHAQRLSDQRPDRLPPLNVCIEVNVDREPQKSGIPLEEVADFAREIGQFPRLQLRGLMAVPAHHEDFELQRQSCHALYQAYQQLKNLGFQLDTLSMGMTGDMVAAIAEGSTMLRIGTGIFGERK